MKPKKEIFNFILRCLLLVAGLFILALGIALSAKSGLGVSPVSSTAYVLSLVFPPSMGTFNNLMNLIYMLIQLILLGRAFRISRLLQLVVVFIFSYFTDFTLELVSPLIVNGYVMQLLLTAVRVSIFMIWT